MTSSDLSTHEKLRTIARIREFQETHGIAVADITKQAPIEALHSLREATDRTPRRYQEYLGEAVDCYESRCYRAAVLMVWSAAIEHIYSIIEATQRGYKIFEAANFQRFGNSNKYKKVRKKNDLLYLSDRAFLLICEDAGVFNRNARAILEERLDTRNRCGHPTGYVIGRDETVVFIESLVNNVINGAMMDW